MSTATPPRLTATTLRQITFQNTTNHHPKPPQQSPTSTHHQTPSFNQQQTIFFSLLTSCTNLTHLKQIHTQIYHHGFHHDSYLLTKLIRTLTQLNCPMDGYPLSVFREAKHPNSFLWTAMIRGHFLNGTVLGGFGLYKDMRRSDVRPTSFTFCALFKGCTTLLGDLGLRLGRQLHGELIKFGGFTLDLFLHAENKLVDLYVKCGSLKCARKVFDEMSERDVVSRTSLIVACAKEGDVDGARELFDEMGVKDVVVCSAMITAYVRNARPEEGLELFERMRCCGVEVDEFTLASVISACAQLGTTKYASCIRVIAEELGCGPVRNVYIGSALVDMYSKCGRVDDAFEIFCMMSEKDVYTYSSMIMGFAVHGRADEAMQLFYDMERTDIRPNHVTFIGVLTAYSHAGMVEEGRRLFRNMESAYGVTPTAHHYTCMVDLLGRSGHLDEALDLANSLPTHPHGGVWGALLGACRVHNNPDIAEIAASHLFELEPNNIGNYVLLCNVLRLAGRWDSVSRVMTLMTEKGVKKHPARSWVEGKNGRIQEFFAGDLTHRRASEIKQVLEDLVSKLRLHGYQPQLSSVSYDISDDDKMQMLMTHSEKLALAFELLTNGSDHTIRIMKNLRICEDCHVFMCGASKIIGREIIIRDNMRFHHFRDGVCSCGNFW